MILIRKLYDWICSCWARPPRPASSTLNDCYGPHATGAGENPLMGIVCTDPPLFVSPVILAQDPPQCYGGMPPFPPCDPMPTFWRVAFPCTVPGSSCQVSGTGTGGTGTGTGTAGCVPIQPFTTPSGPAPIYPPYEDCPSCWTINPTGITGATGSASAACCDALNGPKTLCYVPGESQGDNVVWGVACDPGTGSGTGACDPLPNDANRRLWQLNYNKTLQKWQLFSFQQIEKPQYELSDVNPCVGNTKVLTRVAGGTSGCNTSPATITITRGTNCVTDCPSYVEPGCQVQLWRQCGSDAYGTWTSVSVSANPRGYHLCNPHRGHDVETCCDVDCEYQYDLGPGDHCCPVQGDPFVGNFDPWFDRIGDIAVWKLDFDAVPVTLTGSFIEGDIVYEVDTNGVQCDGVTKLNQVSTTLPSDLAALYPSSVCMVPGNLMTCNVRIPSGTGTVNIDDYGPCKGAGYNDWEHGQQQFCDCLDTCNPSLLGFITLDNCTVPVCLTRQSTVKGRDPTAKTKHPRIACAAFFNTTTHEFNVVTLVVYCVGPGSLWAADWYCSTGGYVLNPRDCIPCSAFIGDFRGTTYANKSACGTVPVFSTPAGGMGDCKCSPNPCCDGIIIPADLNCTISGCISGSGVLHNPGGGSWTGTIAGQTVQIDCIGAWRIAIGSASCSCPSCPVTATTSVCSPFELHFNGVTLQDGVTPPCGTCGAGGTVDVVVTL